MNKELLRLFTCVYSSNKTELHQTDKFIQDCLHSGYIISPLLSDRYDVLKDIEEVVGLSGEKANSSFHKSWKKIKDLPLRVLVIQQIRHYFTTYGFESLGIYNRDTVYIPMEILEVPEITESIRLTVVNAIDSGEILHAIIKLDSSGIALSQQSLDDIMVVIKTLKFDGEFIKHLKNRELKSLLNDFYNIVPQEPVEYLRHVITKLTDESLVIKNAYLIDKIKGSSGKFLDMLLKDAPDNLASIFFRYKPLFLAMKSISRNKKFFNQLRKMANIQHIPLGVDYLNDVTNQIKKGTLDPKELGSRLINVSIFRKIRLAYALKFRMAEGADSIMYQIRNGRGWVTDFKYNKGNKDIILVAYRMVLRSIIGNVENQVMDKVIYIPKGVGYTIPSTEKQFTGNIPNGSYVKVPEDMIAGIHWENTYRQIDLDLSVIGMSGKIGWDADYRSTAKDVLFSGDVTDAPKPLGASELFYFRKDVQEPKLMMVNYYNFDKSDPVQCKIVVAGEKTEKFGKNYIIDINNILAKADITINKKQNVIGLFANIKGQNRMYFYNVSVGNSITSTGNEQSRQIRGFLFNKCLNTIDLGNLLEVAGAEVVREVPEGEFIDLSLENLTKSSIIDLLVT